MVVARVSGSFRVWPAIFWPVIIAFNNSSPTLGGPLLDCRGTSYGREGPELEDAPSHVGGLLAGEDLLVGGFALGLAFGCG